MSDTPRIRIDGVTAGSARHAVLKLLEPGVSLSTQQLYRGASTTGMSAPHFLSGVLIDMHDEDLIHEAQLNVWHLTDKGRKVLTTLAKRLADMGLVPPKPADPAQMALPRQIRPLEGSHSEPEYRELRPGAYDFLQCPSRQGNLLKWRDGRVARLNPDGTHTFLEQPANEAPSRSAA